jgi:hypothetical protein
MPTYKFVLKDNNTKETKECSIDIYTLEDAEYILAEGNYSCDCNRGYFFYGSDARDFHCGDERFELISIDGVPHGTSD